MFRRKATTAVPGTPTTTSTVTPVATPKTSTATSTDTRTANGTLIEGRYRLEKTIGKGSYGKVKLATDILTGQRVAIKFIARSSIKKPAHVTRIRREINLLMALHHPNIVGLHSTMEGSLDIILVMEYVPGSDLFERIVGHPSQRFDEDQAKAIFEQIVAAVAYCHGHRVLHRDLKPENVMIDETGRVKLIDFGFANMYHPRGFLETNCGSPLYAAPEIVQGVRYIGPEVDLWSLGVILFAMLTGTLPFEDEQLKGLYAKISAGQFVMPSYLSSGAKDLLRGMLNTDSKKRFTIGQVAKHPWLHGFGLRSAIAPVKPQYSIVAYPDENIIFKMTGYGFTDSDNTRIIVSTDPDDPATAIYHLLVEKEHRDSRTSKSMLMTPPATPMKQEVLGKRGKVAPFTLNLDDKMDNTWVAYDMPLVPKIMLPPMEAIYTDSSVKGEGASLMATGGNIVSQAAATVANHFKKLRGIGVTPVKNDFNMDMELGMDMEMDCFINL